MKQSLTTLLLSLCFVTASAQSLHPVQFKRMARSDRMEWFSSNEARQAADSAMRYQYPCGGWAKNHDWQTLENDAKMKERQAILQQIAQGESLGATIDNGATTHELMLLAKVYAAGCQDKQLKKKVLKRYREAVVRGIGYLLEAQYGNGGWPQFYPLKPLDNEGHPFYSNHITFNDDAMHNVLIMLREIYEQRPPYDALQLDAAMLTRVRQSFDKGIECILDCQIRKNGRLTVWCQQHDEVTLAPAPAHAYELASFTGSHETASLLSLLMSLEEPSARVVQAVTAQWSGFRPMPFKM
jgi:pectinesterase